MTYRVEFHSSALAQLKGLPGSAFDDLVQRIVRLVDEPWDAVVLYPDEPEFRQAVFGSAGLVSFHLDQVAETIRIFDVTWAG